MAAISARVPLPPAPPRPRSETEPMSEHVALLQIDIVDSTKLGEALGDVAMSALWTEHDRLARDLLREWRGREIDKSDGFLLMFADAGDAVGYALAYRRALSRLSRPLKARSGLHVGPVIVRENPGDDVARGAKPIEIDGSAKPLAARVMALANGGQILITGEARAALGSTAHKTVAHGHWRLKGLALPIELFEVGDETSAFLPPPDSDKVHRVVRDGDLWVPRRAVPTSLPVERDAFVGRVDSLQDLRRRVEAGARLISILGPGGIGKTRLAQHFGWMALGDFPGGVWFCNLSSATTLDGVLHAVAAGLQLPLGGSDPLRHIGSAIAGRGRCMVILDNLEQVGQFSEETFGYWMQFAPEAHFVVTSRISLGVAGDGVHNLSSLGLQDGLDLFARRARAVRTDFQIRTESFASANRLIKLLDGLPLAIELAASRTMVLSLEEILERMHERFRLLTSSRGRSPRHSTLRRTLDWSWDLLAPFERTAVAKLSVFEGGFTLAAYEAVVTADAGDGAPWSVDVLQALVEKSLVRCLEVDRFDMLLSIREFAKEKLVEGYALSGANPDTKARHAAYFASLDELTVRRTASKDVDNFVAACRWAIDERRAALLPPLLQVCWAALKLVGPFRVALQLAESAEGVLSHEDPGRGVVCSIAGSALQLMGIFAKAEERLEAAVSVARLHGDRRIEAIAGCALGECQLTRGDHPRALANFARSLELSIEIQDAQVRLLCLNSQASYHYARSELTVARESYEAAIELARAIGDRRWQGGILGNLANIEHAQGNGERATRLYEEALALSVSESDYRWAANTRCNLGMLYHQLGRSNEGKDFLETALLEIARMGNEHGAAIVHCNLGIVCSSLGLHEPALHHLRECAQAAEKAADMNLLSTANGYLAVQHARSGELDIARDLIRQAYDQAIAETDPMGSALLAAHRAEILFRSGDVSGGDVLLKAEEIAMSQNVHLLVEVVAALDAARACRQLAPAH